MSNDTKATIVKVAALLIAALVVGHWLTAGASEIVNRPVDVEDRTTKTERLVDRMGDDCWGADGKDHGLPTAAIIENRAGRVVYTTDWDLVDEAFTEAIGGPAASFTVVKMCR